MKVVKVKELETGEINFGQLKESCEVSLYQLMYLHHFWKRVHEEQGIKAIDIKSTYDFGLFSQAKYIDNIKEGAFAKYRVILDMERVDGLADRNIITDRFKQCKRFHIYIRSCKFPNSTEVRKGEPKAILVTIDFDENEGFSEKELSTTLLKIILDNFPRKNYMSRDIELSLVEQIVDDLICYRAYSVFKNLILSTEKKKED